MSLSHCHQSDPEKGQEKKQHRSHLFHGQSGGAEKKKKKRDSCAD